MAKKLPCGAQCSKYTLFFFNFLFFLSGIAVLIFGSVMIGKSNYSDVVGNETLYMYIGLIVAGGVITIITFFGCCGAIIQSSCMLHIFSILMTIIFLLELAGFTAFMIYRSDIQSAINDQMVSSMSEYSSNQDIRDEWDEIQSKYDCCGADGPEDWLKTLRRIPDSCCEDSNCSKPNSQYHQGCIEGVVSAIGSDAWLIGGVALGVAAIQLIELLLSSCLAGSVSAAAV